MANAGNNKNAGHGAGSSKSSGKPHRGQSNSKAAADKDIRGKIAIAVFVMLMLLLFLCNFGLIGTVGDAVSGFLFGVFGTLAYITPPVIVALFFLYRKFKRNSDAIKMISAGIGLYFMVAIICDMISPVGLAMESYSFATLYKEGAKGRCGGGLVSGTIAYFIHKGLGYAGLVIILLLGIFILLVILTQGKLITGIQKIIRGLSEDHEVRAAQREERRRIEAQENERRLIEDRQHRKDDADNDEGLLRNKNTLPTPGFNENAATGIVEKKTPVQLPEKYPEEGGIRTSAMAERQGRNDVSSDVEPENYRENKLTLKQKIDMSRAQKQERQKARAEEKEVKSILKIVPPSEDYAVPTKYKQDMHEVFIGDTNQDGYNNYSDENYLDDNYTNDYYNDGNYADNSYAGYNDSPAQYTERQENGMSGHGYPSDMQKKSFSVSNAEYNGLEGSVVANPLQKVKIKKQELRSEHIVNTNEEFSPLNTDDHDYNNKYDLDKFETEEPHNVGAEIDEVTPDVVTPDTVTSDEEAKFVFGEQMSINNVDSSRASSGNSDYSGSTRSYSEAKSEVKTENKSDIKTEANNNDKSSEEKPAYSNRKYQFPPLSLLKPGKGGLKSDKQQLAETAERLQETLRSFGVNVSVDDYVQGPAVTRFEMTLEPGTKVSKILSLADDIKYSLASADVRIEAPIPGKSAVGIEVPNKENSAVSLRTLLESTEYKESKSTLSFGVGMNIGGEVIVSDIAKMPHVLIAGATGSGKSVCINTLIMSLLYKSTPDEVQMILIDPKVVELSVYNGIPHLLLPVVTDPKKAAGALAWGVKEMEERYKKFADLNVRDLKGYNEKIETGENIDPRHFKLPKIVIIIDELADLMMTCGKEVEAAICRLAQLARACGIHLVVATQRPSVDVITGLIKANMPSRMAFAVSQGVDSRTILDTVGAEKLLGKGDMLFYPQGKSKPERVQGAFVSDEEVSDVVDFLKKQRLYNFYAENSNISLESSDDMAGGNDGSKGNAQGASSEGSGRDELYAEAGRCVINTGKGSIGFLQRKFQIGFNRAARIMDALAEDGVVGGESGTKAREILMSIEEFESFLEDNGI